MRVQTRADICFCMNAVFPFCAFRDTLLSIQTLNPKHYSCVMTRPASHNWPVVMAPKCFACPEGDRLQWPDRSDTLCLGRCSSTNRVSAVSLSVLCRRRMDICPVTLPKQNWQIYCCSRQAFLAAKSRWHLYMLLLRGKSVHLSCNTALPAGHHL